MGKLSLDKIKAEVESKGCKLIDASNYETIKSDITVECEKGHQFVTNITSLRSYGFECPFCSKHTDFKNPTAVPPKTGYRVIAFDQATEKFGLSIWDDGQLVFFNLYTFSGVLNKRLAEIKKFIQDIVIPLWQPDYIVCEDIQYQYGAVLTYKVLAMLLGIIEVLCTEYNVPYEVVSPNVWRKYAGTCGKTRLEEKNLSIAAVKQKYNIKVGDDVAEAILIGSYAAKTHKKEEKLAFGKK